ncbi:MAG: hypothetical protein JW889_12575 [Verrucomicrobia bacterium]|nr:hypothetical protein [Verrucomicrobiota bacterium]
MKRVMMWIVVGAALVSLFSCCARQGAPVGRQTEAQDPNTALADAHWGAERIVYAGSVEVWDSERTVPGEEQWDGPQPGRVCYRFTYRGDKLVRIDTLGPDGTPFQALKEGQRVEWRYGPHGKLLDEIGYTETGEMEAHNTRRYDAAGRLVEQVYGYGSDTVVSKVTWEYEGDAKHPSSREMRDEDGRVRNKSTFAYGADGTTRTERHEPYDDRGAPEQVVEFTQKWNPQTDRWEDTGE